MASFTLTVLRISIAVLTLLDKSAMVFALADGRKLTVETSTYDVLDSTSLLQTRTSTAEQDRGEDSESYKKSVRHGEEALKGIQDDDEGTAPALLKKLRDDIDNKERTALARHPAGLKASFDNIAKQNMWGSSESISGLGSELAVTAPVRACLSNWIAKYHVKTFVDVPCGDANWQASIPGIENTIYKGYDIADLPVKRARQKHANHTFMSFGKLDLSSQVPSEKPDIIMVRDVIQHVPLQTGRQMLLNAKKSGARYLAVTSFQNAENSEISAGSFYRNNVHESPFNLPASIESCQNDALQDYLDDRLELFDLSKWNAFAWNASDP